VAKKRLEIDMIAGSQLRDTQGEMLAIDGADINDLEFGRGRLNDNHGKGFFNSIGRVLEAKKIFKAEDCVNERHKYYWEKVKAPYIYVRGELYDDEDHPNAKAAAAILRNIHKSDCPLKIKASVEGGVVARGIKDASLLAQTKIHSIALTFTPANAATLVEPLNLDKSAFNEESDLILIRSVMHLAKNDVPNFRMVQKAASAAKAARNIKKIQKLLKQAREEDIEKGVKETLVGAALAGSMAFSPVSAEAKQPAVQQQQQAPKIDQPILVEKIKTTDPHLWAIAQQESSGGKNLQHETLASGQHKGQTAGGAWGMMPKTVGYVLRLSKNLRKKYPKLTEKVKDLNTNHGAVTKRLNEDPKAAYDLAKTLYNHIKSVHGDDVSKIFHSWHYGIEGTGKAAKEGKDLANDEYVQKIINHLNGLEHRTPAHEVKKALTAGYGGAGAPTSMTGGGVFQTEELDGCHKFRHVVCDNCGDEQIYSKHQVRCRKCNNSFSLAKLLKLMS